MSDIARCCAFVVMLIYEDTIIINTSGTDCCSTFLFLVLIQTWLVGGISACVIVFFFIVNV